MDPIIPDETAFLDDLLAPEPVSSVEDVAMPVPVAEDTAQVASFDAADWLNSMGEDVPEIPVAADVAVADVTQSLALTQESCHTALSVGSGIASPSAVLNRPFVRPVGGLTEESAVVKSIIARQGFRIGNLQLMVPFDSASELSEMLPIYRLPNCAAWFKGLINLHGNLIPVFDLAVLFGVKRSEQTRPMLLVLNRLEPAAVMVDGMPERLRFAPHQRVDLPALPRYLKEGASAAYGSDQGIWLDVDAARIFAAAAQKIAA